MVDLLGDNIMITKKMIRQAKKAVECVRLFAHHEYIDSKEFVVDGDTYILCTCECGWQHVHVPNDIGGMDPEPSV